MIIVDTLRFDCVGYQSEKRYLERWNVSKLLETPTLDRLAEKGVCFTNAFSASTVTCPSVSTILTGLYPPKHGVRVHGVDKLGGAVTSLPEILNKHGYTSVLFSDAGIVFDIPGLGEVFDYKEYTANEESLFALLSTMKSENKPVFLVYHVFDVHSPYLHTDEISKGRNDDFYAEMEKLSKKLNIGFKKENQWKLWNNIAEHLNYDIGHLFPLYARGVTKFDKNRLKNFIANVGTFIKPENNLFLIFSDHGEGRCDENIETYFSHGGVLRDEIIRIPLIMIHPDYSHKISDNFVSTADITPTVLSLMNVKPELEYAFDGDSLSGSHPYIYSEQWINDSLDPLSVKEAVLYQRCIRTGDKKYVLYGNPEQVYLNPGVYIHGNNDESIKQLSKALFYITDYPTNISDKRTDLKELDKYRKKCMEELSAGRKTMEEIHSNVLDIHRKYSRKFEVYDLKNDLLEEKPLASFKDSDSAYKESIYMSKIVSIHNSSLPTGKTLQTGTYALEKKADKSIKEIRDSVNRFGEHNAGAIFTGNKDSVVLLHLVKRAFKDVVPFRVFSVDTPFGFEEVYEFRDWLARIWGLYLIVLRNENAPQSPDKPADNDACCHMYKTSPLHDAIKKYNIKALMTSLREDDQAATKEDIPSMDGCAVVHPILHFTEEDIERYEKKYNIPSCSLYQKGYRNVGCKPCTRPSESKSPQSGEQEQDKEKIIERLKDLGYF